MPRRADRTRRDAPVSASGVPAPWPTFRVGKGQAACVTEDSGRPRSAASDDPRDHGAIS